MQIRKVKISKVKDGYRASSEDFVAVEEPLQIFVNEKNLAIIMRTPGNDLELTLGFLYYEDYINSLRDVEEISMLSDNEIHVRLTNGKFVETRNFVINSSCGICGRGFLNAIELLKSDAKTSNEVIISLPEKLRSNQGVFNITGGLHAAALFTLSGELISIYEDVGRHNAVDKIIGSLIHKRRLPFTEGILQVSGRIGYEIVSKAIKAGIPIISGISAPTSKAIEIAEDAGATLVGFVRGNSFNVYTHPERIDL
ncbi:formate dehydrogenase accessory sulfurtransferase FdhD [Sulfolobus acidocaldarius]|uniref:Sulfur carrier protein FdhD n=4 Tax=Sulfolobus acidocaldarius TaxID=2285 RepID=FDHD_SULAC|nr:formate dehydrogenase accessory sulfurtransferase FdhD [Sulfolobus acidocaldarius]Q4JBU5.1 RecName: Full=Sulfur carrier protein FdhD [Sulfolobus acidocaldarius DSM 639]AAY79734.1 formate dehydrogenase [Sulfolobus acidocaldarius DSM 639]AGE70293.1 formate dehydrogenase [Sulfolobus acidocaldarius N8]AGE72568.1 formate dehydrogenase [Sulfolobus acidocaldarius Ron12/I]ALU29306.1 formate dehydrogenase accessory protein FdhD [Sulfolobus acidocaldarius]ALU32035.1 formate dehydrogenase accessory p